MAFDATKAAFEPRITNNEFNELCNITGILTDSGDPIDAPAGILCTRVSLLPCEGFTGVYNENAWELAVAAADTTEVVYASNTYDVQLLAKGENAWAVGTETLGLPNLATRYGNFTVIEGDGQHFYRFGEGNISDGSTPTVTSVYVMDGAGGLEAGSAPTAGSGELYFTCTGVGAFTVGTQASFGYADFIAQRA